MVRVYADEVAHTPVRAVLMSPGPMRTRMRNAAFPGEDPETLPPPEAIGPLMVDLALRGDGEPERDVSSASARTRRSLAGRRLAKLCAWSACAFACASPCLVRWRRPFSTAPCSWPPRSWPAPCRSRLLRQRPSSASAIAAGATSLGRRRPVHRTLGLGLFALRIGVIGVILRLVG